MDRVMLDVTAVAHGGVCVARVADGRTVFVRHTLPGERVVAEVTEDRGRFLRADAVEVLVASPDRVSPPCPYAGPGRCGGCDWQHASVAAQRVLKATVVREQLRRLAGIDWPVAVARVDEDGLGWRTRVGFAVRMDGVVGLKRHRSGEVEPVDACLIAHAKVEEIGAERQRWPGASAVEVVASATSGDRAVIVSPRGRRAPLSVPELDAPASVLRGDGRGGAVAERGRPGVREHALGREFRVSGSGFWQVHPAAPELLSAAVLAALEPCASDLALDLYGGVGLFAAALAPHVRSVVLVESSAESCADARHNLADLRVDVREGRVDAVLPRLGLGRADVVALDPPRAGAGERVVRVIASLEPRRIAYVACDPASLARDLATFATLGYRLADLTAHDLFPMTAHVECVATLVRTGSA